MLILLLILFDLKRLFRYNVTAMNISPFKLERYFAKYEFTAPYLLCSSDCEPLTLKELLDLSDKESSKLWNNLWLGYTTPEGHPILREEVSKLYSSIQPNEIIVVAPEEGIFLAMNSILKTGDHVITTFPGYQSLYEIAKSIGCKVDKWTPVDNGTWEFNFETLSKLIRKDTKLIVINFPHNPTGSTLSKDQYLALIRLAEENNIIVFSDEMYRYLEYSDSDRLESASDLSRNAISLFGLSKTFSLAGLRIGWLTTKNEELRNKIAEFKDYTTICNSAPSEILAIVALKNKLFLIERNKKIIKNNLTLIEALFRKHSNLFEWISPKAGPIAFPRFTGASSAADFCKTLVETKGVMLLPSNVYDFQGNHFRIGFGRRTAPKAIEMLEEYLQEVN